MVSTRQQSNIGGGSASCISAQAPPGAASVSASSSSSSCLSSSSSGSTSDSSTSGSSSSTSKSCRHHVSSTSATTSSSTTTSHPAAAAAASSSSYHQDVVAVSAAASSSSFASSSVQLLDLPHEVLEKILSYIGFKNVSQMRLVCRHLDRVCSSVLNLTFQRLQTQMLHRFQAIKAKMPRRESARRTHPLACESDIIETLHMRLTLLQMSFGKHIERKHCCFFAGEILDEVYRILHYIRVTPKLARPYKVTDELFDLSTMAMEYFKEHIEPTLPEIAYFGSEFLDFSSSLPNSPPHGQSKSGDESPVQQFGSSNSSDEIKTSEPPCSAAAAAPQSNIMLRKRIRKIKQGMKRYSFQLGQMRRELRHCKGKIADQQKQIVEYGSRLDENDKKNEETSRKFSTVLQELNKCKTELQYWRSKSPSNSCTMCVECVLPGGAGAGVGGVGGGGVQVNDDLQALLLTASLHHHAHAHSHAAATTHHAGGGGSAGVGGGGGPGGEVVASAGDLGFEACAASFPAALPGTSAEEVWNAAAWGATEQDNKTAASAMQPPDEISPVSNAAAVAAADPKQQLHQTVNLGKRKATSNAAGTGAAGEMRAKSAKKQRAVVFKFRSKRL